MYHHKERGDLRSQPSLSLLSKEAVGMEEMVAGVTMHTLICLDINRGLLLQVNRLGNLKITVLRNEFE